MTSSRDVKVLSADPTVLEMIPLNFSTSKTLKTIPIKLLYDFYKPRYNTWHFDVMYDVITWRQSVKRWSYSLGNDSIEFLDLTNLENDTNKVAVHFYNPRYNTWHFDVMYDVITWRQSVKRWSYSLGNDSIEFLDLKNL